MILPMNVTATRIPKYPRLTVPPVLLQRTELPPMLLPDFDFPQGLRVGPAHLFGLEELVLALRQTKTIGLQELSSLILQIRHRFEYPIFFIVMTACDGEDAPDRQAKHDRLLHQSIFV
jgi:hypothetical protein